MSLPNRLCNPSSSRRRVVPVTSVVSNVQLSHRASGVEEAGAPFPAFRYGGRDRTALADEFQIWPFCYSLNDCGPGPCGERASARYHRHNEDKGKKERHAPSRSVSEGTTFRLPAGLDRAARSLAMTRVPNVFHGHNRKCERYSRGKTSSGIKTLR
jgi:hypothetical protein